MPWIGVGVYLPGVPVGRSCVRAGLSTFEDFAVGFVDFFAALLRAAGFFATARFFMPRTLPPVRVSVNAPAVAAACP